MADETANALTAVFAPIARFGESLGRVVGSITEPLRAMFSRSSAPSPSGRPAGQEETAAGGGTGGPGGERSRAGALASIGQAAFRLADAFVSLGQATANVVTSMTSAVTPFVTAFNPAALIPFQMALDSVTATIGRALQPVIEAATGVVQSFAQTLAPIMAELGPVVARVSQAMAGVLSPVIDALAATVTALLPVIEFFTSVFQGVATVLQSVIVSITAVLKSIMDAVGGLFGGGNPLQSFGEMFVSVMQRLAQVVILATAAVAQFFGATSVVGNLIKGLSGGVAQKGTPEVKAPTDARFTSFSGFGQSVLQSAFTASAAGAEKKSPEESWRSEILAELQKVQNGSRDIVGEIKEAIKNLGRDILTGMAETAGKAAVGVYSSAKESVGNALSAAHEIGKRSAIKDIKYALGWDR